MNKKNNRKGFTIVELVIVIAVIAILAVVLVPTFGNVIEKANKSKALQEARNEMTNYMIETDAQGGDDLIIASGGYFFAVVNGQLQETAYATTEEATTAFGEDVTVDMLEPVGDVTPVEVEPEETPDEENGN